MGDADNFDDDHETQTRTKRTKPVKIRYDIRIPFQMAEAGVYAGNKVLGKEIQDNLQRSWKPGSDTMCKCNYTYRESV